jgi:tripartite-type tricarboxylate transporter receptor subunit TctC
MRGMRAFGYAAILAIMLVGIEPCARAQSNYPSRPIHIVVPYPAGGIVDIVARALTEQVGRDWKQAFVVEARPGANSNIGGSRTKRTRRLHLADHGTGGAG